MNDSPADPNAGSLLESYQYDDEETTDLLNAIKNWNLNHDSHVIISHDTASASRSLSSTIATNTDSTDYDTLTASSTFENYSRNSYGYATNNRSTPKTPLCNYSSRPSSLTARILQDHGDPVVPFPSIQTPPIVNNKDIDENELNYKPAARETDGVLNQKDTNSSSVPRKLSPKKSNRKKSPLPQYVNTPQKGESDSSLEILKKTAIELGLDENDLESVLPTVQKLVKVVTQHVPRLENFVDEVCTIVDKDEIMPSQEVKKKKKRSRNSAAARKERMDNTVQTLKLQWPSHDERQVSSAKHDSNPSETIEQKPSPEMKVVHWQDEMEEGPIFSYEDYQSYGAFTTAVKERLTSRRQLFGFDQVRTPISSNKDDGSPKSHLLTDFEALDEINRLIEFEQRYNGKVTANSSNGNGSDDEGDEITSDLLKANAVTLRRFVVHFAYLFTVKQDEMMNKMNDLYVFSHEATRLIDDLRNAMGMSPNCPIHTVAREVVSLIEKQPRKGDK